MAGAMNPIDPMKFGDIWNSVKSFFKSTRDGVKTGDLAEMIGQIHGGKESSLAGFKNTITAGLADAYDGTSGSLIEGLYGNIDMATKEGKARVIGALRKAGSNSIGVDDAGEFFLKDGWQNEQLKLGFWNKTKLAHMDLETGGYDKNKVAVTGVAGYMTAAAGYRLLSGGGLYRDKDGNTDIVGIPFV